MALADNLVFAHFGDALEQDSPASGVTPSTPTGLSAPTATGSELVCAGANARTFTNDSGNWITGGTGDFSIAVRANLVSDNGNGGDSSTLINIGAQGGRNIALQVRSHIALTLQAIDDSFSGRVYTDNNAFSFGTPFTLVFRRSTAVCAIWVDGVDLTALTQLNTRDFNASLAALTLGSNQNGTDPSDSEIEFAVVWDRALTDTEIQNSMDEATLKTALGIGAATGQPFPSSLHSRLVKTVVRMH